MYLENFLQLELRKTNLINYFVTYILLMIVFLSRYILMCLIDFSKLA